MRHTLLVSLGGLFPIAACVAAPAPPLEQILLRAETVFIGRLVSGDKASITVEVVETLRGKAQGEMTFSTGGPPRAESIGAKYLFISQGDDRYGQPQPIIDRPMSGQGRWCGWMLLPISAVDGQMIVEAIFSLVDRDPDTGREPPLSIERVRSLVRRFSYDPKINDTEGPAHLDRIREDLGLERK